MNPYRHFALPLFIVAALSGPALAAQTIAVTLNDQPAADDMPTNDGMGMSGNPSTATMIVAASPANVAHGPVTFNVTNASKDFVHEMLVVKVGDANQPLTYDAEDLKLNEDKLGSLGEVPELDPGKSGTLTLDLAPGTYALLCNQPGQYMAGMWTLLKVI